MSRGRADSKNVSWRAASRGVAVLEDDEDELDEELEEDELLDDDDDELEEEDSEDALDTGVLT